MEYKIMSNRLKAAAIRFWKDESGASLVEYSILIGIITVGVIATVGDVGDWVSDKWTTLLTDLKAEG
jgi:pilus assembly protein Flp/PilA